MKKVREEKIKKLRAGEVKSHNTRLRKGSRGGARRKIDKIKEDKKRKIDS